MSIYSWTFLYSFSFSKTDIFYSKFSILCKSFFVISSSSSLTYCFKSWAIIMLSYVYFLLLSFFSTFFSDFSFFSEFFDAESIDGRGALVKVQGIMKFTSKNGSPSYFCRGSGIYYGFLKHILNSSSGSYLSWFYSVLSISSTFSLRLFSTY